VICKKNIILSKCGNVPKIKQILRLQEIRGSIVYTQVLHGIFCTAFVTKSSKMSPCISC
jgi:hypothetical protein